MLKTLAGRSKVKKFGWIAAALMLVPCFANAYVWRAYNHTGTGSSSPGQISYWWWDNGAYDGGDLVNYDDSTVIQGPLNGTGSLVNVYADFDVGSVTSGIYQGSAIVPTTTGPGPTMFNGIVAYEDYCSFRDNSYVGSVNLEFENLDPAYTYNIYMYGDRGYADGDPTQRLLNAWIYDVDGFDNNTDIQATRSVANDVGAIGVRRNTNGLMIEFLNVQPGADGDIRFWLDMQGAENAQTYMSAFMIEAVPEPTTVALFGLGGLLLMARRKRK